MTSGGEGGAVDFAGGATSGAQTAGGGGAGGTGEPPPEPGTLVCQSGADGGGRFELDQPIPEPVEWTLADGVTPGTLTDTASYESEIYGQHFPYRIYTSANYIDGEPAVFMTFGDGGTYIAGFHAPTVLDNLTAVGAMPPTVALFVDPPSDGDRVQTYDPPTDKYSRFLLEEIIPDVITPDYSISMDPNAWATGGYSASGEQGWTVLWLSDRFRKFIGANTSFGAATSYGVDWTDEIMNSPPRDLRVSLTTAPVGNDLVDQRGDWTLINDDVAGALDQKGSATRRVIAPGGHDGNTNSRPDFPAGLSWVFQGCSFQE